MVAIFAILTITAFILVDFVLQRRRNPALVLAVEKPPIPSYGLSYIETGRFPMPKGFFFHPGHTWANIGRSGKVKIGLDDFVQRVIGRFDSVKTLEIGDKVEEGQTLFTVKQRDRTIDFVSPVDGVITSVNENILHDPSIIKRDPYKEGWIYIINPVNFASSLRRLQIAEKALAWFQKELEQFRDFMSVRMSQSLSLGQVIQDGGIPVEGLLEQVDDETWSLFEKQFLMSGEQVH